MSLKQLEMIIDLLDTVYSSHEGYDLLKVSGYTLESYEKLIDILSYKYLLLSANQKNTSIMIERN